MLTISQIKQILRDERISISKYRGQNFLVDQNLQGKIVDALGLKSTDEVIEIGPGLGALTGDIAVCVKILKAIEKDKALAARLKDALSEYPNLEIIHQDILKTDLAKLIKKKAKVVGNLPYYITTPIIALLLEEYVQKIDDIFITVQHEVGKRLIARKNSKDYSSLSVFVQYFTEPKVLFSIPKRAFYPQPKVDSVFVHLSVRNKPKVAVKSQDAFFKIVRFCFQHRRKTILNALNHHLKKVKKDKLQEVIASSGVDPKLRAENLSLVDFSKVENAFYKERIKL